MSLHDIFVSRIALANQGKWKTIEDINNGLSSIGKVVASGIAKKQEEEKERRKAEEEFAMFTKLTSGEGNTDSSKIGSKLIPSISYEVGKGTTVKYKTPTPAEQKIQREAELEDNFSKAVSSGRTSIELARMFPSKASEIAELEELNVISPFPSLNQGQMQKAQQQFGTTNTGDAIVTELTPQGRPKSIISSSGKIEEGKIETIQKVQETQTEEAVKSIRSFNRVKSAAQGLVAGAKRIVKEQGGFGLYNIAKGKIKRGLAKTGFMKVSPENAQAGVAEYRGQLKETVLALSPILTNQNRIIQGVVDMLSETLWDPNKPSTGTEFTAQLKQTTKNAYKLSKALNTGALSADEIRDLNSASVDEVKRRFKQILNKSSWTEQDEKDFEEEWKEVISTPATTPEDLFSGQGSIANKYGL